MLPVPNDEHADCCEKCDVREAEDKKMFPNNKQCRWNENQTEQKQPTFE